MAFSTPTLAAPKTLTFVHPDETSAFHDAGREILSEAYRKLGIEVIFVGLPGERALQMANTGKYDGEAARIEGIEREYPNLLRIPVKLLIAEQMAFGRSAELVPDGWQSLAPYRIGFSRGYKAAEQNTHGMQTQMTSSDEAALRMVARGRIDVAIVNRFAGERLLHDLELANVHMLLPPLQQDPIFHYLHSRHSDLLVPVTNVLSEMEVSGEIAAIRQKYGLNLLGGD